MPDEHGTLSDDDILTTRPGEARARLAGDADQDDTDTDTTDTDADTTDVDADDTDADV